jgi:DNA-binding PadR family transcriptional regulator
MIDSYTDQILLAELESQRGVRIPQLENNAAGANSASRGAFSGAPAQAEAQLVSWRFGVMSRTGTGAPPPGVAARLFLKVGDRTAAIEKRNFVRDSFEGVSNMYGRGCGSWWRGGMGAAFGAQFMGGGFPFGRGGRWGRFFGPGEVRLALLSMLESGPKHGYELMKELETKSGGVYKASAGAIYPALQQLEDEGLVISDQAAGKRTYSLTDAGRGELQREAETVKRIWLRAEEAGEWWIGPESAEVMRPAAGVMKAAMRVATRRWHDSTKIDKIREILERTKREIEELEKS